MRTHILGEISTNTSGDYMISVDDDDKVTVIDRNNNHIDVTEDKLICALLYTLEFHKEQHDFGELELTSLRNQVEHYQNNEHKFVAYQTIEDRAREVMLRYPQWVEGFKLTNRSWNFYDSDGKIIDHTLPFLNTFHRTFQELCSAYDIGDMYVRLTPVHDISKPADDQFVMIIGEYIKGERS